MLLVEKWLLAGLALIVLLAGSAASAQASAQLDPGFGAGGTVFLPGSVRKDERTWKGPGLAQPLADGRVLVQLDGRVIALLPSGAPDPSFGEGGSIAPQAPAGRTASLSSFAVDPLGRAILVGSSSSLAAKLDRHGGLASEALVQRFTASGQLDPGFGGGDGTVVTDFGFPPPVEADSPEVTANSAVLDRSGRIVVLGQRAEGIFLTGKPGGTYRERPPFFARLTSDGEVDPSYAAAGILSLPIRLRVRSPIVDPEGGVFAVFSEGERIVHLDPNGRFDPGFGAGGGRPLPPVSPLAPPLDPLGVDPSGQLLIAAWFPGWGDRFSPRRLVFRRLLPDGSRDRGYGDDGLLVFRFPRLKMARAALDQAGRILVAMTLGERHSQRKHAPPTEIVLARLQADGGLDPSFGRRGVLPIPFPGKANLYPEELTLQGDGAALIQVDRCNRRCRTALVRIDLGSG